MRRLHTNRPDVVIYRAKRASGFGLVELLVVIAIIAMIAVLFLPSIRGGHQAARRSQCKNNLKQIGMALHNYHEMHGSFPPAYTVDANGRKLHSWRTLLLPFMEQKNLYDQIDLSKPWDDPANAAAFQTGINAYRCPSAEHAENHTTYLAIVTSNSCLQPNKGRTFDEITDGTSHTLMVIEVDAQHAVPWMSPQDADEQLLLALIPDSKLPHEGGMQVLLVDGSTRFVSAKLTAANRRALITINANDAISEDGF